MRNLEVVLVTDKESGQSSKVELDTLANPVNSVITLPIGPEEIAAIEMESGSLLITLTSGRTIVIEGFFDPEEELRNELILEDSGGVLWWGQYELPWSEFSFTEISLDDAVAGEGTFGWLLAAAAGGGLALAATGSSSSSDDDDS
ncbi:MAG TPA: BapA prefix-like domain-containing protein, partial [Halomonas sp.]|nr:BapA prefix-like domain-containing protein [Halomonas sp.]